MKQVARARYLAKLLVNGKKLNVIIHVTSDDEETPHDKFARLFPEATIKSIEKL